MTPWKAFRYRLEELGCRLLVSLVPRLSRTTCVRLARVLGKLAYRFDQRGRAVALSNLECVFGDRYSLEERQAIALASYQNFARTMVDLFWSPRLTNENFRQYMKLEGFDELQRNLAEKKTGALFFCTHQGNWEWASLAYGFLGYHTPIVAESFKNSRLNDVFSSRRQVSGHLIIPQENSILRLLKSVKRGGWAGLLLDLNLRPSQAATVLQTFKEENGANAEGLEMCAPVLHAVLAQRAGAQLFPTESDPLPDGTCRIRVHPPVEWPADATLQEIAQRCWERFEPILRERPEQWMLAYKHFRYRPRNTTRTYPYYSNESGAYEKLRKSVLANGAGSKSARKVEG